MYSVELTVEALVQCMFEYTVFILSSEVRSLLMKVILPSCA
jgi:hypothetical protein